MHGYGLAIICEYDVYLEITEGKLDPSLTLQHLLEYNPIKRTYNGDAQMRVYIKPQKRYFSPSNEEEVSPRKGKQGRLSQKQSKQRKDAKG